MKNENAIAALQEIKKVDNDLLQISKTLISLSDSLLSSSAVLIELYENTLETSVYRNARISAALGSGFLSMAKNLMQNNANTDEEKGDN